MKTGKKQDPTPFTVDLEAEREKRKQKHVSEFGPKPRVPVHEAGISEQQSGSRILRKSDLEEKKPRKTASFPNGVHTVRREREALSQFVAQKKEMFLLQYALSVKREEMQKLEETTAKWEDAVSKAERNLEEDAMRFEQLLKENNLRTMEATKSAETETKAKLEKQQEIKRFNLQIASVKGEIAKYDERLEDCRKYQEFLDNLTPPEWFEENRTEVHSGEPESMYFKDPGQLLSIFKELEERNMFLIHQSQESERVLEELRQKHKDLQQKMERETRNLRDQISVLEAAIAREKEKRDDIKKRAQERIGQGSATEQEVELGQVREKVEQVYVQVVGENAAGMGTLQMLMSIERRMEELFVQMESLPKDYVVAAEKARDRARRQKQRDEKLEEARLEQERKLQRAIERSNRPVVKRVGKPVMFRSYLPEKVNWRAIEERRKKELEKKDLMYFGLLSSSGEQGAEEASP